MKSHIFNVRMKKLSSKFGMALNIHSYMKARDTKTYEIIDVINPFSSFLYSAFISFIIGAFANPYSINFWFNYFSVNQHINWIVGGILACIPGLGKYTLFVCLITFILHFFL